MAVLPPLACRRPVLFFLSTGRRIREGNEGNGIAAQRSRQSMTAADIKNGITKFYDKLPKVPTRAEVPVYTVINYTLKVR